MQPAPRAAAILLAALGCAAPRAAPPRPGAAAAWLDGLDGRYRSFDRALTLRAWQQALGEGGEAPGAEEARRAFFTDGSIDARLRAIGPAGQDGARARAWLRFRASRRAREDGEVARLSGELARIAAGDDAARPEAAPLWALYGSPDPEARARALRALEDRTAQLLPLLAQRARALDAVARRAGEAEREPPEALRRRLAALCRTQGQATAAGWAALIGRAAAELGRPPTLADYLSVATRWTGQSGAFLRPEALPALAEDAFGRMGFPVASLGIVVRTQHRQPGGAAYGISIPDDVRFQGHFPPGFEGARGYFHELGHAVHMKSIRAPHLPARMLPEDRALSEGVGEIFALPLRDAAWLRGRFPDLPDAALRELLVSVEAFDAVAVRYNCLHARLEAEIHAGLDGAAAFPALHRETFGAPPAGGPVYMLTPYLKVPLYTRDYVLAFAVRQAFVRRLGGTPLLSTAAGERLRRELLAPGNAVDLESWLADERR